MELLLTDMAMVRITSMASNWTTGNPPTGFKRFTRRECSWGTTGASDYESDYS
jgi:hypothetical protein